MIHSYSKWATFDQCPAKFDYKYNQKLPDQRTVAMSRGVSIHESVEQYLAGTSERMHESIHGYYVGFMNTLKELLAQPEKKIGVKHDWTPTGFNEPDTYARCVLDILVPPTSEVLHIFELKTGKVYDDHATQRHMYGTFGLSIHPDVRKVEVTNIYLDLNKNVKYTYDRLFLPMLQETWDGRFKEVEEAVEFPAMPGMYCRWCPYGRANNGPCEF